MRHISQYLTPLLVIFSICGCTGERYPKGMTNAERKEYYKNFNESKTDEEWEQIRQERENSSIREDASAGSIPFGIKNNSLSTKRLRIADNVLDFKPLKTSYVGFEPGTKVYLIKGEDEKDEYLFTITEDDEDRVFRILN